MNRDAFVLAAMAAAENRPLSPVQVQKLFFLLDQNVSDTVGGPYFNFEAYDYGPFDKEVYRTFEVLANKGFVFVRDSSDNGPRQYSLTAEGVTEGSAELGRLSQDISRYIVALKEWLQERSFTELVSYIYQQYPKMKENSVFQD